MLVERLEIGVFAVEMHGDELLIVAGDDQPVVLLQNLRAGERHGDVADDKIDVRIDDGHDVDPQTHGRKDGDDQGEEFAFHLGPSFLVRLAASFLKRDFFSVSSAISSLDSSFCSVWGPDGA